MVDSVKPDPDPTKITTENMLREVDHAKELVQAEQAGAIAVIEERMRWVDRHYTKIDDLRESHRLEIKQMHHDALTAARLAAEQYANARFEGDKEILRTLIKTVDELKEGAFGAAGVRRGGIERLSSLQQGVGIVVGVTTLYGLLSVTGKI